MLAKRLLTIDHASLSKRNVVPTPCRGTHLQQLSAHYVVSNTILRERENERGRVEYHRCCCCCCCCHFPRLWSPHEIYWLELDRKEPALKIVRDFGLGLAYEAVQKVFYFFCSDCFEPQSRPRELECQIAAATTACPAYAAVLSYSVLFGGDILYEQIARA